MDLDGLLKCEISIYANYFNVFIKFYFQVKNLILYINFKKDTFMKTILYIFNLKIILDNAIDTLRYQQYMQLEVEYQ